MKKRHHDAMIEWAKNRTLEQKEKQLEWARKKKGSYSKERIEKAKDASIKGLQTIQCVETGEKYSASSLGREVNIDRGKIKQMILNNEEINGKHYFFFREYWRQNDSQ